jgi:MOSC domain-containing protein YiiM
MSGKIEAIFTASNAGEPLFSVESAILESGKGLVGDRYYRRIGTFSEKLKDDDDWQVTLIESEQIDQYNASQAEVLSSGAFRRNIVTSGIRLNDLAGQRFDVGQALLEGIRLCEPCAYLGSLLEPGIVRAMAHKAGLRARILTGAEIRPGDRIGVGESHKEF